MIAFWLYCIKNVLLKFTVFVLRKFKIAYVAYIILDMYWAVLVCRVQFVWTLHFAVWVVHLGFIDIHVCFLRQGIMAFIVFSKGHLTKVKVGTALEIGDNLSELLLVVTWVLLVAWIWGNLFLTVCGLGKACSTRGVVRCILGFSSWNSKCSHRDVFIERH